MRTAERGADFERCLVAGLQVADECAVRTLVNTFGPVVFQQARRRVLNYEDAEEITQDVLVTVLRRIAGFRQDAALASWIYRITLNAVISHLRARRRLMRWGRRVPLDATPESDAGGCRRRLPVVLPDGRPTPEERLAREQIRQLVNRTLAELSPMVRRAIVLHYARGLSVREAGALMRLSPKTVRIRLTRGRQLLRARLAGRFVRPARRRSISSTSAASA